MPLNRHTLTLAAGAVMLIVFVMLAAAIFQLRASSGDVYAPYSTYRADPLGAMALYGALDALPGRTVDRYIQPFDELPDGHDTTMIIAGASLGPDPVEVLENIEAFAMQGGRVVIAFHPITNRVYLNEFRNLLERRDRNAHDHGDDDTGANYDEENEEEETSGDTANDDNVQDGTEAPEADTGGGSGSEAENGDSEAKDKPGETRPNDPDPVKDMVDISERWGFGYEFAAPESGYTVILDDDATDTEPALAWRTGLHFDSAEARWNPVYLRPDSGEEDPGVAVMEMELGRGAIVLASGSYLFSNEAMRNDRAPRFLDWLIGSSPRIYISEVHLGTQQQERIMTLVRRYRLHGVLLVAILLGALFVWKNATALLPRVERAPSQDAQPATASERSHQDGLDNLLARFVQPDAVLDTCVREWLHHHPHSPRAPAVRALHASLADPERPPLNKDALVAAYNRLVREVHPRH